MARPLRIEYPGALYHVTSRGNARAAIFDDDSDRTLFLNILSKTVKRFNWLCHAYCLMDNHYHLMIETPDGNLSAGMRQLNGVFTQAINRSHGKDGHIFKGRFKAVLVEKQSYLTELCRYVVLNPVRAGMVTTPEEYAWSSYLATLGKVDMPVFLTAGSILLCFSSSMIQTQQLYQQFVIDGTNNSETPWEKLTGQVVMGTEAFLTGIKERLYGKENISEIPRIQRYLSRPLLTDLFPCDVHRTKDERNRLIYDANVVFGYSLKEISDAIGLHYTTISKVLNQRTSFQDLPP
jgi:REP element-mobilizing transposase RayT